MLQEPLWLWYERPIFGNRIFEYKVKAQSHKMPMNKGDFTNMKYYSTPLHHQPFCLYFVYITWFNGIPTNSNALFKLRYHFSLRWHKSATLNVKKRPSFISVGSLRSNDGLIMGAFYTWISILRVHVPLNATAAWKGLYVTGDGLLFRLTSVLSKSTVSLNQVWITKSVKCARVYIYTCGTQGESMN